MGEKILLTISILISNRPDTVRKCLDSVQPLLEAIPSELILTDTGCGEQVRGIIESYTDHIIEFEWCRDFSKARNAGLEQAGGEWFLFLDDDEWFEDVSEIIDFFVSGEYRKYGFAAYTQRNYLDRSGSAYTDLAVGRMTRLEPDIHFIYSIHECFNRVPGKVKKLHSYVHHYGYAYRTKEEALAHSERNISLLLTEHEKHPENMKHTLQLAQEYNAVEKRQESLELSLEGIAYAEKHKIDMEYCLASLYGNVIDCYMELKRYDEAAEKGEMYLKCGSIDPLVEAMIEGLLAVAYIVKRQWEKCAASVTRFTELYGRQRRQEDIYLEYTTTITSDCFEQRNLSIVLGAGVRAAIAMDKGRKAYEWFREIDLVSKRIFISDEMVHDIVRALARAEESCAEDYQKMCGALMQRKELQRLVTEYIRESIAGAPEARARFADISSEHWYITLLKVQTGTTVEKEDFQKLWREGKESLSDIVDDCLWERAEQCGLSNREVIESVPLYLWREAAEIYCKKAPAEKRESLQQALIKYLPEDTWHLEVWREHYLYAKLLEKTAAAPGEQTEREKPVLGQTVEALWNAYAVSVYKQAEALCQPAILAEADELLPAKVQAAKRVLQLQELVQRGSYAEAVSIIKEVKELVPDLAEAVRVYLEHIRELMAAREAAGREAADQFAGLAGAVKAKALECIENKDYSTAEKILTQLETLLPGDAELLQMRKRIEELQA